PEKRIARQPCDLSRHTRQTFNSLPNANYRTKLAFTSELLRLVSEATDEMRNMVDYSAWTT
ncbi:MAG: hypothetical protein J5727_03755, partial [Kiritimatiellae bacterium]|nr:hypothetical protein [Kiritimatiellia bacterium]